MAPQFIYVMKDLRKVVPPSREILRGIWLSFYPGAKIGVLGANGAGKSSLLRIMAGVDHDFQGEAWPHEGTRIGFLPQEPELDPTKDVQGNVEEAVRRTAGAAEAVRGDLDGVRRADGRRRMEKLLDEQAQVQEQIDAARSLGARPQDRDRDGCAASAAGGCRGDERCRAERSGASRCAGCCSRSPTCCCSTSRRTISMPRASRGSSDTSRSFRGPSSPVTHDRYFLDNVAKWILELDRGYGDSVGGELLVVARAEATRLAQEEKQASARQRTLERELEWVRMSPRARQAKSKARIQKYEELASEKQYEKIAQNEIVIPPAPRLGNDVVIAEGLEKAYRRQGAVRRLSFSLPRGGHRRRDRAERRGEDDAVPDDRRQREA